MCLDVLYGFIQEAIKEEIAQHVLFFSVCPLNYFSLLPPLIPFFR